MFVLAVLLVAVRVALTGAIAVVDPSVMPAVPPGQHQRPTIAVAERAADLTRGNTPLPPA